jgi:hypothetical protein
MAPKVGIPGAISVSTYRDVTENPGAGAASATPAFSDTAIAVAETNAAPHERILIGGNDTAESGDQLNPLLRVW